ncbi:PLP-dependent cysteine synthase family protein [Saccharopolyspora rhizosphaerae]|uniref:PLP-dependent cysteine synthase family protein n=1 Tax=Saccharopolyspora rhizosphaerae TaxID=2492662 RepID=UPI001F344998|nr:PLP-dependent cysteine synthase family protein [Saccharopolyspora rhizosphaerae]
MIPLQQGPTGIAGGRRCESLLDLIGDTPVLRVSTPLPRRHPGFWAKLEAVGPATMKARAALSMLRGARERGELRDGAAVVESSSGTLAVGLAFVGSALGHPVVVVADRELDEMTRRLLRAYGARVELVSEPHPVGGWQRARLERVHQLLADLPGAYWPDQYNNPDNPAGYREMGRELAEQFDALDAVVCSVGTGGHSAGIASVVRERWPEVRIIGVDSPRSSVFGHQPGRRLMRGLGSSLHPDNVAYEQFDEVHWVGPAEAADACRRLAAGSFVSGGWSTGATAMVAAWCARELGTDRVAAVFPDGPERYWESVYDDEFCRRHGLTARAVEPDTVDDVRATAGKRWARCPTVPDPCRRRRTGQQHCPVCEEDAAL